MEMLASVVSTEGKHQDGNQQGEHEGAEIGGRAPPRTKKNAE
jgi:hypothetical protein